MKKQFIILLLLIIGIFVVANKSEAKINSYDYNAWNETITLHVDGFIPVGQICDIRPEATGVSFNNSSDLYNVVVNNIHVFGGADISGATKNTGWKVVFSCSDSEIPLSMLWFGNLGIGKSGPFIVKVGNSSMNIVDETVVCISDTWSCGSWGTCSSQGNQTRTCNITSDCPSVNTPSPSTSQLCTPSCTSESWSCSNWNTCSINGTQTRSCSKILNCEGGVSSPATTQSCTYIPPICTSWQYSNWSQCSAIGQQTRTITSSSPGGCVEGEPILSQSCNYIPTCTANDWSCNSWSNCSTNGTQTRNCNKISNCQGGISSPVISQSCSYAPQCSSYSWSCGNWSTCSSSGSQARICNKISNCEGGTQSPVTTQSCTYAPTCSADTWSCGSWGSCSPQGIQTRSCSRTFDCPSAETASPAISQYCEAPNQPKLQSPTEDLGISNQDSIIKATVKLVCPVSATMASQGSGTIINSSGLILTNKHVIDGTPGCIVGFIDSYNDEPYFGDKQIADIYKTSSDADVAILKLRNPSNKILTSVNISQSNSSGIKLGEILTTYGYPAKFGTKITYTSGDFSGVDGNYLKTTAVIEHGNSGGGAYLKNGTFIGIPSAVVKGSLNSMGYLLSVDKIKSWMNGTSYAYNSGSSNNYSRVSSIVEDIDSNNLGALGLFIADSSGTGQTNSAANNKSTDKNLQNRLKGYILLQVESAGEAWYVNPTDGKRYYMKDGATAYQMMRNFSLGITNANLAKIPQEGGKNNYPSLVNSLKGKILLQVEASGEAWYVNPKNGYRYYMKDGAAAYSLMRYYSLGITNNDLRKIPEGSL